jgi:dUTPase
VLLVATWLLGRWPLISNIVDAPRAEVLVATGIAVVISVGVAAALFRRDSSIARGIGLSTAASAAVVLIGAIPYACWLL